MASNGKRSRSYEEVATSFPENRQRLKEVARVVLMPWGAFGRRLGHLREAFGRPLGGLWEAFGRLLEAFGGLWEAFGRPLGGLWEALGRFWDSKKP